MRTAIVTGANGFVGSALVKELLVGGITVIALDREGCCNNIPSSATFVPFDLAHISDVTDTLKSMHPDTYYHLGWFGMNGETRGDISVQMKNMEWTVEALRQAKEIGCKKFIGAGSIMEYESFYAITQQGNRPGGGFVYGTAKLAAHSLCMIEANRLNIDLVWPEITNAYGPGERSPRLVNSTIQKCMRSEAPQFTAGTQNYDFVYIDDVVRAFRMIGERGKPFHKYLIGSSSPRPLKEFLLEMQAVIAPSLKFQFGDIPFTGTNLPLERFDCTQTERDTGFRAEISFAEGCRRTMEWWKQEERQNDSKI